MNIRNQPRIFNISYLDHTSKWSGGEIALYRVLLALNKRRVNSRIILPSEGIFAQKSRSAGLNVNILALKESVLDLRKDDLEKKILKKISASVLYIKYAISLARLLKLEKTDIIHCNSLKSDIYGMLAGRISNIPVVWHVRDHINESYLPHRVVKIFRAMAKKFPAGIIVNSQSSQNALFPAGFGNQYCSVIYDGLMDTELQNLYPPNFSLWQEKNIRIGLLGRIVHWKGQHVFLDAIKILSDKGFNPHYQIIGAPLFGEDDYETQIRKQASALSDRIEFLGFRDDVSEVLRNLDILVHCSILPEPFGQVVIEGMAQGLPVIASDAGGVKEIIIDGVNGIRTPMGNAQSLADALVDLITHPERASVLGQAAYKHIREKFTAAHSARAIESFYDELILR
jgi:glycosyltransferase involved in cell wall biosynthesis